MGRRAKPAKPKVRGKRKPARRSPPPGNARVRDLERRLAETRAQLTEARDQQTATTSSWA